MQQELEAPLHPKQKRQVLEAIRSLGFKVVPADVAAQADLPVLTTTYQLNRIAAETNAHLEVSADGTLTYAFDPGFEYAYALTGPRNLLRRAGRIISNAGLMMARMLFLAAFFLIRVSFGVLLIASVVAIVVILVMAIIALLRGSDSGGGSGDSGGGGLDLSALFGAGDVAGGYDARPFWLYFAFDWLWDWIYFPTYFFNPYGRRYGYSRYGYGGYGYGYGYGYDYGFSPLLLLADHDESSIYPSSQPIKENSEPAKKKSKFLDNCFTLLFGDGDPNSLTEEKRWRNIAQVIRLNQGVITCEQVLPYLDNTQADTEDWMLPILIRFNGVPNVSETGNIIYSFPAFQQHIQSQAHSEEARTDNPKHSATAAADTDALRALYSGHLSRQKILNHTEAVKHSLEPYLKEELWDFGNLKTEDLRPIFAFAAFAVFGSLGLLHWATIPIVHYVVPLLLAIACYGGLFFFVPAIRWCINRQVNEKISARNDRRLECSAKLSSPSPELQDKLSEARALAVHAMASEDHHLVYTTEKDSLEQELTDAEAGFGGGFAAGFAAGFGGRAFPPGSASQGNQAGTVLPTAAPMPYSAASMSPAATPPQPAAAKPHNTMNRLRHMTK